MNRSKWMLIFALIAAKLINTAHADEFYCTPTVIQARAPIGTLKMTIQNDHVTLVQLQHMGQVESFSGFFVDDKARPETKIYGYAHFAGACSSVDPITLSPTCTPQDVYVSLALEKKGKGKIKRLNPIPGKSIAETPEEEYQCNRTKGAAFNFDGSAIEEDETLVPVKCDE